MIANCILNNIFMNVDFTNEKLDFFEWSGK